jgi:hypothetical protein
MVTRTFCDIIGCKEEADPDGHQKDVCTGWLTQRSGSNIPTENFEPYERMYFSKKDLCTKHLKMWAKGTYEELTKAREELEGVDNGET